MSSKPYHFYCAGLVVKKAKSDFVETPQVGDRLELPAEGHFEAGTYEVQRRTHKKDDDGCPIIFFALIKL